MSKYKEKEEILHLEDFYDLRGYDRPTPVTVHIGRWHYHIPRVRLTIVEGHYETRADMDQAIFEYGKDKYRPDYPKHFQIACRLEEMEAIANRLAKICGSVE